MLILNHLDITPLLKAHLSLIAALQRTAQSPQDDMLRDACIQRFEFTFELAWKTLKRILAYRGLDINSPRQVFRYAGKEKLIFSIERWFVFLENRNLTSHVYNEKIAETIYAIIPEFSNELSDMIKTIQSL